MAETYPTSAENLKTKKMKKTISHTESIQFFHLIKFANGDDLIVCQKQK